MKLEIDITFAENVAADQIVDTANDLISSMENAAELIADDLTGREHVVEVEWAVSPQPTKDRDELIRDVERELNP